MIDRGTVLAVFKLFSQAFSTLNDLPYQTALFLQLFSGAEKLPASEKEAVMNFIMSARCPSGGFRGRQADDAVGDLYYTAFALRGLALLGGVTDSELLGGIRRFLESQKNYFNTPADLFSFIFCRAFVDGVKDEAETSRLLERWREFLRADACYASSTATRHSSTLTTFLAASAFEILETKKEIGRIDAETILRRQRQDGGFVELEPLQQSGTNPTAAAIALLKMKGRFPRDKDGTVGFLLVRQRPDGGFQANTRIPVSDLLSSFTAFVALRDLEAENRCDVTSLWNYVESLKVPEGGYRGADWDDRCDVEYTFYGLGLKALLTA